MNEEQKAFHCWYISTYGKIPNPRQDGSENQRTDFIMMTAFIEGYRSKLINGNEHRFSGG